LISPRFTSSFALKLTHRLHGRLLDARLLLAGRTLLWCHAITPLWFLGHNHEAFADLAIVPRRYDRHHVAPGVKQLLCCLVYSILLCHILRCCRGWCRVLVLEIRAVMRHGSAPEMQSRFGCPPWTWHGMDNPLHRTANDISIRASGFLRATVALLNN